MMRSSNSALPTLFGFLLVVGVLITAVSAIEAHAQDGACWPEDAPCFATDQSAYDAAGGELLVKEIPCATRRKFSADEKIRTILE